MGAPGSARGVTLEPGGNPMANQHKNKMPKAIRISRKLALSSEKLVLMSSTETTEIAVRCTVRATGCPAHTC
jgi:hypothetical protein